MSAVIGALRVDLSINTAAFTKGLQGAQRSLQTIGNSMKSIGEKMSLAISAPLAAAAGAATLAISGLAKESRDLASAAQVAGVGFEEFQKLSHAARTLGIESDKLGDIFKDVNDKLGDFAITGGGELADFFEKVGPKIGVTYEDFRKLSGPQGLQLLYNSLVEAGVSGQEMTFFLESIADEASLLAPLLANNGELFRQLGESAAVVSEEDRLGLALWSTALLQVEQAVKQVTIALVQSGVVEWMANLVTSVATFTREFAASHPEVTKWTLVVGGIGAVAATVAVALGAMAIAMSAVTLPMLAVVAAAAAIAGGLYILYQAFQAAKPYLIDFTNSIIDGMNKVIGIVRGTVTAIVATWRQLPGALADVAIRAANSVIGVFANMGKAVLGQVQSIINAVNNLSGKVGIPAIPIELDGSSMDGLKLDNPFEGKGSELAADYSQVFAESMGTEYISQITQATEEAKASMADLGTTAKVTGAALGSELAGNVGIGAGALAGGGKGGKGGGGGSLSESARKAKADMEALKNEGKQVWEETRTPLEAYNLELERLSTLLKGAYIDQDTYNRAVKQAKVDYDEAAASASKLGSVGQTFTDGLKEGFKGLVTGSMTLKDALSQLLGKLADFFMDQALQGLFGGGGSGGGGGILGSVFSGLKGLLGFQRGGSFQVGGGMGANLGGVDSSLVAFRANPRETVSISRPGDDIHGEGGTTNVLVTPSPYFDAHVQKISDSVASQRVAQGQAQAQRQLPTVQTDYQRRNG